MKHNNVKFLSLPQQVEQNRKNIEYLETMYNQIFTTQIAIENQSSLLIANLTNIEHKPVVGDIIYGSDSYYAQITRVGESVVEFTVIGQIANLQALYDLLDVKFQEAKDYSYSKTDIDDKDADTLQEAKDYTDSSIDAHNESPLAHDDIRQLINSLDGTKLSKSLTDLVAETELSLSDVFVIDKGSGSRKITLATLAGYLATGEIELFTIVEELPTEDQNPNTIYLLVTENEDSENQLLEYIWIEDESRWEMIGSVAVDLSNYYTKTEVDTLLEGKGSKDNSVYYKHVTSTSDTITISIPEITQYYVGLKIVLSTILTSTSTSTLYINVNDLGPYAIVYDGSTNLQMRDFFNGANSIMVVFLATGFGVVRDSQIMTQTEFDDGTITRPRQVTPKLLRDNFYTQEEVDDLIGDIEDALDAILGV